MSIFNSMNISSSGLTLERMKIDTISSNIANVNTTRTADGGPYKRKEVTFEEMVKNQESMGVKVTGIKEDNTNLKKVYDPSNADAGSDGYVTMPNVNLLDEMVNLMQAQRTYEANATALKASKNILNKALEISKG